MSEDPYKFAAGPATFGARGVAITPGAEDFAGGAAKGIVCTDAGDVTIVPANNANADTITFPGCPVGFVPPFRVRRVTAATGAWVAIYD